MLVVNNYRNQQRVTLSSAKRNESPIQVAKVQSVVLSPYSTMLEKENQLGRSWAA